jgi:glycosyltransferase involved in cell wall biosynthesis
MIPSSKVSGMSHPLVSVVIVTYNHEQYIRQAIDSVLAQEAPFPFEILISEDCSTDSTRDIVRGYQRRDPEKISLFLSERNQCDNEVMTRAILAARGKYVALLDGDDYWTSPGKLERQVEYLERHPEQSICFHRVQIVYESTKTGWTDDFHSARVMNLHELLRERGLPFHPGSSMLRVGAVSRYPEWFNSVYYADWALTVLHAERGSVGYIDEEMAVYRVHDRGAWSGLGVVERCQRSVEFYESLSLHFGGRYARLLRRATARHCYALARARQLSGQSGAASEAAERGLAAWPYDVRLRLLRHSPRLWGLLASARTRSRLFTAPWRT